MKARRSRRDAGRSTDDPFVGAPSGNGPTFGTTSGGGTPLWPGVSPDAEVPASVPRLDDVLGGGSGPVAGAWPGEAPLGDGDGATDAAPANPFPEPQAAEPAATRAGRRADAGRTTGRKKRTRTPAGRKRSREPRPATSPVPRASQYLKARATARKARSWLRRGPRGVGQRPATMAGTAAVALLVGIACGLGYEVIGAEPASEESTLPAASPESCAVAQVAWARSATAQVRMSAEDPATLRTGFLGARDALADVQAPAAIAADWRTVTGYIGTVAEAVADVKDDDQIEAAVANAVSSLDTPAMTAAAGRVTTYLRADCDP